MVDDMRRRGVTTRTAKPFIASQTFDDAAWIMDTTVSEYKRIDRQQRSYIVHFS